MTQEELIQLIEGEISDEWSRSNLHGVDLKMCLVPPTKQIYEESFKKNGTIDLWLVLEEEPVAKSGYKIIFDEKIKQFGLAVCGDDKDVLIGYYGMFLETPRGM